jgi:hypothetical protein
MARGGTRAGAGRPKGAHNKRTIAQAEAVAASGLTPLDFMLSILRDEKQTQEERMEAAKNAAPYCHARLQSIEADMTTDTYEDRLKRLAESGD